MQPLPVSLQSTLRLNTHSRSLWVSFPRQLIGNDVLVILYDHNRDNRKFNLHVIAADAQGLEIKFPQLPNGMYFLKIKDGNNTIVRQVAIQ